MHTTIISSLIFSVITTLMFSDSVYAQQKVYSFGVVPQQSARKTALIWEPIFKYITKKTGIKLKLKTNKNIPEFEDYLKNERYDLSYMNPYHYTVFHDSANYTALATAKDKKIKGILVIRKDNPITSISQLNGIELAFPSQGAFAASMLPRAYLLKMGIKVTPVYVKSHDTVYRNVARAKFTSGGGVVRTFNNISNKISDKLKILWTSNGYTPHAIAAHSRVDKQIIQRIQEALTTLHETEQGIEILKTMKIKGFIPAINSDWNDVRSLKIGSRY